MVFFLLIQVAFSAGGEWAPSVQERAIYRQLSVRHPVLSCEQIDALAPDNGRTLLSVIEHAKQPAWVGMRAGQCVIERHAVAQEASLLRWVREPQWMGLGRVVLSQLDQLPLKVALRVGRAATQGPLAEHASAIMARSTRPDLVALSNAQ